MPETGYGANVIDRLIRLPASLKAREIEHFIMVRVDRRDGWWATPER
jgi:hypothetical protein